MLWTTDFAHGDKSICHTEIQMACITKEQTYCFQITGNTYAHLYFSLKVKYKVSELYSIISRIRTNELC